MLFSINQKEFVQMAYRAQCVVERKTTMPILSHVLLRAKDGHVHASSTDLEMSLQEFIPASIDEEGSVALPVVLLHDILKKLSPDSQVIVSQTPGDSQVVVKSEKSKFKLPCLEGDDFPNIQINKDLPYNFQITPDKLLDAIDMVKFSIAADGGRYNLGGICLHTSVLGGENFLDLVTSDGHRLSHTSIPLISYTPDMPPILISKKMAMELFSILIKNSMPVEISFSENQIVFEQGDLMFISRLVDATFPPYQEMIPHCSYFGTINAKVFFDALERLSPVVLHEKSPHINMLLSGETLKLYAPSQGHGEGTDELLIDYNGPEISLMMNLRYLIDIVSRLKETEVQIDFENGAGAIIVKDMQNPSTYCILMPMRG